MKKILALLLVLCMTMALLAGCGGDAPEKEEKKDKEVQEEVVKDKDSEEDPEKDTEEKEKKEEEEEIGGDEFTVKVFDNKVEFEKISDFDTDHWIRLSSNGMSYSEDNKYGIMSLDGKSDTGAIYAECDATAYGFKVSKVKTTDFGNMEQVNVYGLVDAEGNELIPYKYADIVSYVHSDGLLVAFTATSLATDDNYVCRVGDKKYNGTWCVYDMKAGGKLVPNVSGNTNVTPYFTGELMEVRVNNERVLYNRNGVAVSGARQVYENSTYKMESKIGEIFNADGTKLFEYDLAGYVPNAYYDGYYVARKYENSKSTYVLMDETGTVVSAEFGEYISGVVGKFIYSDEKLYDFQGKEIMECENTPTIDPLFGKHYYVRMDDDVFAVIDETGNIIMQDKAEGDTSFDSDLFTARTKKEDEYYFYCYGDKDYTIKTNYGSDVMPWFVSIESGNNYAELVSVADGKTILKGYTQYTAIEMGDGEYYLYAASQDGTDLYRVNFK